LFYEHKKFHKFRKKTGSNPIAVIIFFSIHSLASSVPTPTSSVSSSISNGKSTPLMMDTILSTISTISDIHSVVSMNTTIEWSDRTMIHITPPTDTKDQSTPPLTMDTMLSTISTISDTESVIFIDTTTSSKLHTTPTTAVRPMIFLNSLGDEIIGLYNTTAGASTGTFDDLYSNTEELPKFAMDNLTATKYFNYGRIGSGFVVIPAISKSSVACGLLFATANDNPNRDPITVTLEGSNASDINAVRLGTNWTLIYKGPTGISAVMNRKTYGLQQTFKNEKQFASYRLLISSIRVDGADAVQYSEARIIGYV